MGNVASAGGLSAAPAPRKSGTASPLGTLCSKKLYLQKQSVGQLSLMGHTLPTLDVEYLFSSYILETFLREDKE